MNKYIIDIEKLAGLDVYDHESMFLLVYYSYRKLKSYSYYTNSDINLKKNILQFENKYSLKDGVLEKALREISNLIIKNIETETLFNNNDRCLSLLPKKFKTVKTNENDSTSIKVLNNYTEFEDGKIDVEKISIHVNLPMYDHIIGVLFCIIVLRDFDLIYLENCYSSKIDLGLYTSPIKLFVPYFVQYTAWRDNAIKVVEDSLEIKQNVSLISLDVKDYYYSTDMSSQNFNCFKTAIFNACGNSMKPSQKGEISKLKIIDYCINEIESVLKWYKSNFIDDKGKLPLGYIPSYIIGNWYLSEFDKIIKETLNPLYYGRYVDDIIIVLRQEHNKSDKIDIESLFKQIIIPNNSNSKDAEFIINKEKLENANRDYPYIGNIEFGKDKFMVFNLNHDGSRAILDNFKEEIQKNVSEFNLFPIKSELVKTFDKRVYEITYKDSVNKIRSVDNFKLSTYNLSKIISQFLLINRYDEDNKFDIESEMELIAKKYDVLSLFSLWEKIFVMINACTSNDKQVVNFFQIICKRIYNINPDSISESCIDRKLKQEIYNGVNVVIDDLLQVLVFSISTVYGCNNEFLGLDKVESNYEKVTDYLSKKMISSKMKKNEKQINRMIIDIFRFGLMQRASGMIKNSYITDPLVEYTNIFTDIGSENKFKINLFRNNKEYYGYRGYKCPKIFSSRIKENNDNAKIEHDNSNKCHATESNLDFLNSDTKGEMSCSCIFALNELLISYSPRKIDFHDFLLYSTYRKILQGSIINETEYLDETQKKYDSQMYFLSNQELSENVEYIKCKVGSTDKLGKDKENRRIYEYAYLAGFYSSNLVNFIDDFHFNKNENLFCQQDSKINGIIINNEKKDKLRISISNYKVEEIEFASALKKKPIRTSKRLEKIVEILNSTYKEHVDLLIFPELSIPFEWLDILADFSKKNEVAIICGIEHVVDENNFVYNYMAQILPFKYQGKYQSSLIKFRLKNYYSPQEIEEIKGYGLKCPHSLKSYKKEYDLIIWKGVYFSVYNCFELANIRDRSLFTSYVDLIIGVSHNRDISYYDSIVKSMARDIHSYFIQVNDRVYGDNRITKPTEAKFMNQAILTGGVNNSILVDEIDIASLREFQLKEYNLQINDKVFKPVPPEYSRRNVRIRMRLPL